jgi:hypothetical protein
MVAVLHLLAAWAIAAGRVPFFPYLPGRSRAARLQGIGYTRSDKMRPNYFDNVRKREQERAEKERLRKIFERSLIDDPPKDDR